MDREIESPRNITSDITESSEMKKEKLLHYARKIVQHADAAWVGPFFFFFFFADALVMVLPADSLLGATASMHPKHLKKWAVLSCLGAASGLALAVLLGNTVLHNYLHALISEGGYYHRVGDILTHAQNYGYLELTIGVFTFLPCVIGAIAGAVVGLNPFWVFLIVLAAKLLKILLTLWLLYAGSGLLKRIVRWYLKTSV